MSPKKSAPESMIDAPPPPEEQGPIDPPIFAVAAVAEAIGTLATQDALAETNAALAEGATPPSPKSLTDVPLPFPVPPFDRDAALEDIATQNRRVGRTRREWEAAKAIAKERKDEHDEEVKNLEQLIARLDQEHRDAERRAQQPFLAPVPEEAREVISVCKYERDTGRPCFICRRATQAPVNAESAEHADDAKHAGEVKTDEDLADMLSVAGAIVLEAATAMATWTPEQRADAQAWAAERSGPAPVQPFVLTRPAFLEPLAHTPGVAGEEAQACTKCGKVLWTKASPDAPWPSDVLLIDGECAGDVDNQVADHVAALDRAEAEAAPVE